MLPKSWTNYFANGKLKTLLLFLDWELDGLKCVEPYFVLQ
jgi:hypothetical protein